MPSREKVLELVKRYPDPQWWQTFVTGRLAAEFPDQYRVVPNTQTGEPMLIQWRVDAGCYLQSFMQPDAIDRFHIHRWDKMESTVLTGGFVEERYPGGIYIPHKAGETYTMDRGVIHRFHSVEPMTWTLFRFEGGDDQWGYYFRPDAIDYRPWQEGVAADNRVKSLGTIGAAGDDK